MSKFTLWVKQKSPEILLAAGIINAAASVVLGCLATKNVDEKILKPAKNEILQLHNKLEVLARQTNDPEEIKITQAPYKKDLTKVYFKTGGKLLLTYAPTVVSFGLSMACLIGSHNVMKGRNAALAAAVTTIKAGYDAYRARVRDKVGEDVERQIFEGTEVEKTKSKDENGKTKTTEVTKPKDKEKRLQYDIGVWWGPGNDGYDYSNGGMNISHLLRVENWLNQTLQTQKYLLLSDVYKALGFTPSQLGKNKLQMATMYGWIYDPKDKEKGQNYVSFGLHNKEGNLTQTALDMQMGKIDFIYLEFNIDNEPITVDLGNNRTFMDYAMEGDK